MIRQEKHHSILEMVTRLKKQGYEYRFRREVSCLYCIELDHYFMPEGFIVDSYYYFENSSFVDGDRILYAISTIDGLKGFLVDSCFVYEDNISHEMAEKLKWEYSISA